MKIEMEFQGLAELVKAFEKAASDDEIKATNRKIVEKSEPVVKEGKLSPTTKSIKGSFYERSLDNQYEISVDESNLIDENTGAKKALENWFSAVQEYPNAADNTGGETGENTGDGSVTE